LNTSPADITWRAGVDVLCCGGTKLGMAVTEAVVFFNKELSQDFQYRCKQAGQLCSKMRFISAQWLRMLTNDTWKKHASSANALARRLSDALGHLPGVQILYPVAGEDENRPQGAWLGFLQLHRRRQPTDVLMAHHRGGCGRLHHGCSGVFLTLLSG
jgi:hypothetical protein